MTTSQRIGGLLGPALVVILMFVSGLAVVRWHNAWRRDWTLLVTLCGWTLLVLGLFRMFAAGYYRQAAGDASPLFFMAAEAILFLTGAIITFKAYRPDR